MISNLILILLPHLQCLRKDGVCERFSAYWTAEFFAFVAKIDVMIACMYVTLRFCKLSCFCHSSISPSEYLVLVMNTIYFARITNIDITIQTV